MIRWNCCFKGLTTEIAGTVAATHRGFAGANISFLTRRAAWLLESRRVSLYQPFWKPEPGFDGVDVCCSSPLARERLRELDLIQDFLSLEDFLVAAFSRVCEDKLSSLEFLLTIWKI